MKTTIEFDVNTQLQDAFIAHLEKTANTPLSLPQRPREILKSGAMSSVRKWDRSCCSWPGSSAGKATT